ncbi:MAG: HAMP domain-containing sensor histidine kinase [Planctomycetota bacterium]
MWRGISLANKCLLLFGAAIVLIVTVALAVPWLRMNVVFHQSQVQISRQLVNTWLASDRREDQPGPEAIQAERVPIEAFRLRADQDERLARALEQFEGEAAPGDRLISGWSGLSRRYIYLRPEYGSTPSDAAALTGVVVLDRVSVEASRMLLINAVYHAGAGVVVFALAVFVFYLITSRLILEPVRGLRVTAERVGQGELSARAEITTGDEFEQLGDAFNTMLIHIQRSQDQLRSINLALDEKIGELANANKSLFDAARIKGEFVASVSHELRTPLNSIIGFAELLLEIAQAEAAAGDDSTRQVKRSKYLSNILGSSRHLLEMIDSLLEMARIEAGKAEIRMETVSIPALCEALVGLLEPVARRKGMTVRLDVVSGLADVRTDPKKVQQIMFNFLSNAIKFTASGEGAEPPAITLRAERLPAGPTDDIERTRLSVIDTGPGIDPADQTRIFEKFQQAQSGLDRAHEGTGLGLSISKELATLIQGEIQLVSEVGRGSMFCLILPNRPDEDLLRESQLERAFTASIAAPSPWKPSGAPPSS